MSSFACSNPNSSKGAVHSFFWQSIMATLQREPPLCLYPKLSTKNEAGNLKKYRTSPLCTVWNTLITVGYHSHRTVNGTQIHHLNFKFDLSELAPSHWSNSFQPQSKQYWVFWYHNLRLGGNRPIHLTLCKQNATVNSLLTPALILSCSVGMQCHLRTKVKWRFQFICDSPIAQ